MTPRTGRKDQDEGGAAARFWLQPSMLALFFTCMIQICTGVWFASSISSRQNDFEKRLTKVEAVTDKLPELYVPRIDLHDRDRDKSKTEEARDKRLDRMETKIDAIEQVILALRH